MKIGMLLITAAMACLAVTPALACSPIPMTDAQREAAEDHNLQEATVFFRGVIENYQPGEYGWGTLDIRWTRTLWGSGAPSRISIPPEYFANCARGNLHVAVEYQGRGEGVPAVRNGMGVTVIGRSQDAPWDFIILVDGSEDTQRVVRRFQQLRFGW